MLPKRRSVTSHKIKEWVINKENKSRRRTKRTSMPPLRIHSRQWNIFTSIQVFWHWNKVSHKLTVQVGEGLFSSMFISISIFWPTQDEAFHLGKKDRNRNVPASVQVCLTWIHPLLLSQKCESLSLCIMICRKVPSYEVSVQKRCRKY